MDRPYDPNRPTSEISEPPPALADIPGLLWKVITGAPRDPIHWFGTDTTGLDVFSRVIAAPRTDVAIAVGANLASLIVGSLLGLLAGFARPWIGGSVMRISDLIQAFPVFITGMILVTLAGRSNMTIVLTLAFLYTPIYVRLTRSEVLSQRHRGFVDAARALGKSRVVHRAPPCAAERHGAGADPGVGYDRLRDPDDGGLEFRRRGRAAADARMGPDDRGERE